MDPPANALVIPLLGSGLGALRRKAAGAEQTTDRVGVVEDVKAFMDQLGNPPTGPQCGRESAGFPAFKNPPHQSAPLARRQFRRPTRSKLGLQACLSLAAVGSLPPPDRSPIYSQSLATCGSRPCRRS